MRKRKGSSLIEVILAVTLALTVISPVIVSIYSVAPVRHYTSDRIMLVSLGKLKIDEIEGKLRTNIDYYNQTVYYKGDFEKYDSGFYSFSYEFYITKPDINTAIIYLKVIRHGSIEISSVLISEVKNGL